MIGQALRGRKRVYKISKQGLPALRRAFHGAMASALLREKKKCLLDRKFKAYVFGNSCLRDCSGKFMVDGGYLEDLRGGGGIRGRKERKRRRGGVLEEVVEMRGREKANSDCALQEIDIFE